MSPNPGVPLMGGLGVTTVDGKDLYTFCPTRTPPTLCLRPSVSAPPTPT